MLRRITSTYVGLHKFEFNSALTTDPGVLTYHLLCVDEGLRVHRRDGSDKYSPDLLSSFTNCGIISSFVSVATGSLNDGTNNPRRGRDR